MRNTLDTYICATVRSLAPCALGIVLSVPSGPGPDPVRWQTFGAILGLGALVALVWRGASLPWLVAAEIGGQLIAGHLSGMAL